jgi:hypothetical protein
VPGVRHGDSTYTCGPAEHTLLSLLSTTMNDQTVLLFVIVGGAAGLAIVGVAFWMMRQERPPGTDPAPGSNPEGTVPAPAPPAEVSLGAETAGGPAQTRLPDTDPPAFVPQDISAEPPSPPLFSSIAQAEPGPATPPLPQPQPAPEAIEANSQAAGEVPAPLVQEEVLRLWRSPTGRLIVEVNGRRHRTREEIGDYATAQQVINAARELNQFLNLAPGVPARKADAERPVIKVSLEEAATQPVQVPSMDIMKQMRYLREQSKKPEIKIKSMMDEINEILQRKIAGTALDGRGLKVVDGAQGGIFSLDGRDYESLEELHDPDAREAVRSAVQEWDRR